MYNDLLEEDIFEFCKCLIDILPEVVDEGDILITYNMDYYIFKSYNVLKICKVSFTRGEWYFPEQAYPMLQRKGINTMDSLWDYCYANIKGNKGTYKGIKIGEEYIRFTKVPTNFKNKII